MRRLAELEPTTLALMHGPSYAGDGAIQLRGVADAYDDGYASRASSSDHPYNVPEQPTSPNWSTTQLANEVSHYIIRYSR
jgi:hypothetical protein